MGLKKKNSNSKSSASGHKGKNISTDPRFESVHADPRFAKQPKSKAKVKIDSRFYEPLINNRNFESSKAPTDKRGKAKKDSSQDVYKHYYQLEEEEGEERAEKVKKKEVVEKEEKLESDDESDEREGDLEKPDAEMSDLEMGTDSDDEDEDEDEEESNDESSTDTEEEDDNVRYGAEEEDTFVPDENVPEIDKETHRLAAVNLDWGRVKAVDLYVLLSSFLPKGGEILSVAVYPSDFGIQRMKEEEMHGPVGLFDGEKDKSESDNDDDNDDDDDEDDEDEDEDDSDEFDNEKLRAYERSRLGYYYAVVECNSIATADYIYKSCDGVEFERSSNKLDLRFIPNSMEFKHPPRDVAKEAPADYEGLDFQTQALQSTTIELTWDENEPERLKTLMRKFTPEQLDAKAFDKYMGSDVSETDEDENNEKVGSEKKYKKKEKYRNLLQSGEGSDKDESDDGLDMEVTFNTGLEDLSKRIRNKNDKNSETVWEQNLKKMKEKKKARKKKSKDSSDDESGGDYDVEPAEEDDFFIDELPEKGGKGKKYQKGKTKKEVDKEEEEKSRADLELLLADENGATDAGVKGYNMKRKKSKGKKGEEIPDEGKIPTADYEDPRFSSLFNSSLYALDPTDPQFKRSAAYARQMTQKQQMVEEKEPNTKENGRFAGPSQLESDDVAVAKKRKKDDHELSSLVKSIKMKAKQVQLLSDSKVSRKKPRI